MGDQFRLKWNDYHSNMTSVANQFLAEEAFVDVTLACDGACLKAHQMVLSACSPFFRRVLVDNPCKHPVLILPKEVAPADLRAIVEFIYQGETFVTGEQLPSFLRAAELLKIKGLRDVSQPQSTAGHEQHTAGSGAGQTSYRKPDGENTGPGTGDRQQDSAILSSTSSQQVNRAMGDKSMAMGQNYATPNQRRTRDKSQTGNSPLRDGESSNAGMVGNKRNASQANMGTDSSRPVRRPYHGGYGESWHGASNSKGLSGASPSNDHTLNSDILEEACNVQVQEDSDQGMDENSFGYDDNTSSESNPLASSSMYHQNLYSFSTSMEITANQGGWPSSMNQSGHSFSQSANNSSSWSGATNQERYCKTEPQHAVDFEHQEGPHMDHEHHHGAAGTSMSMADALDPMAKKTYSQESMDAAIESVRTGALSVAKAATVYGIPYTTLWQGTHRLGIHTPFKGVAPKRPWSDEALNVALESLRTGVLSVNRASKEYGIPSSTLYKAARKEGIKLAPPFNASPTAWSPEDLAQALEAVRGGMSVQRAAAHFGISPGTLYSRCKREKIDLLQKNTNRSWTDNSMLEAMEAVRSGEMSMNYAAIHYNVPYTTLYTRVKRSKATEERGEEFDFSLADAAANPEEEVDEQVMNQEHPVNIGPLNQPN